MQISLPIYILNFNLIIYINTIPCHLCVHKDNSFDNNIRCFITIKFQTK